MRDVVKTNVKREQTSKRARRRKKKRGLYIFLVVIFVLGIGTLLSVTLLFNINEIKVNGEVDYSVEDIIKASGIGKGDNLVRLDAKKAEENILEKMVYIESVDVSKKFPDTLEINVEKCIPYANAEYNEGVLLLSPKGKILEKSSEIQKDLLTVKGLEPSSFVPGKYITSKDENKVEIYFEIMQTLQNCKNSKVVSIDMTDKYEIVINYDNRIDFKVGNANDIAYKLKLADTVLEDLSDGKKGIMVMVGTNEISFRSENSDNTANNKSEDGRVPINPEDMPEGYTEPTSDNESSLDDENVSDENYDDENYDDEYSQDNYDDYSNDDEYSEDEYYEDNYEDNADENEAVYE